MSTQPIRPWSRILAGDLYRSAVPIPFGRMLFGYGPFHFNFPGPVDSAGPFCGKPGPFEPSLITDFNGFIGVAAGAGTSTDGSGLTFTCDMRFLQGKQKSGDVKPLNRPQGDAEQMFEIFDCKRAFNVHPHGL